jgi:hypothetical protein
MVSNFSDLILIRVYVFQRSDHSSVDTCNRKKYSFRYSLRTGTQGTKPPLGRSNPDIRIAHFFVSLGGVRLSPLGTSAINWPIVPAPDDR